MKALRLLMAMGPLVFAQELPDAPGKELVAKQCSLCHGLEQVVQHRDTKDGWDGVVAYMISRGMPSTDAETKTIVEYLAKVFPQEKKLQAARTK